MRRIDCSPAFAVARNHLHFVIHLVIHIGNLLGLFRFLDFPRLRMQHGALGVKEDVSRMKPHRSQEQQVAGHFAAGAEHYIADGRAGRVPP